MNSSQLETTVSNRPVDVLCIYGSPRPRGNTDRLMDALVEGIEGAGGVAERVYLRNLKISPCREIYACKKGSGCALDDDMRPLYQRLREADALALASPVMFYGVSAHSKGFIDRCQALWCERYLLERRVSRSPLAVRKGVFLSVGGSKGQKIFDGPRLTFRYFLDTLEARPWKELTYREVDERGDIETHPTALQDARQLGAELVRAVAADLEEAGRGDDAG